MALYNIAVQLVCSIIINLNSSNSIPEITMRLCRANGENWIKASTNIVICHRIGIVVLILQSINKRNVPKPQISAPPGLASLKRSN